MTLICLISQSTLAQQHAYVKDFKAESFKGSLLVSWTTKAGFTCQDIAVQLSKDSISFEQKAVYFGICGDTTERSYIIRVNDVYPNTKNYVRLDLGVYGYSYIISEQVINIESSSIIPHPANSASKLYFNNPNNQQIQINFHNLHGKLVHSASTNSEEYNLGILAEGSNALIYTIWSNGAIIYRGKIFFIET